MIGVWNVRGFNKLEKQDMVVKYIRQHKLHLFGILETKLSQKNLDFFVNSKVPFMRFVHNFQLHDCNRILVVWNPNYVDVEVIDVEVQLISCIVKVLETGHRFLATMVYGLHTIGDRRPLWDKIREISATFDLPWIILGDFNAVFSSEDRLNGSTPTEYEMKDGLECCIDSDLEELNSTGQFYTWSKNCTLSRIDRVFVNGIWWDWFQNAAACFDPAGRHTDHSPCRVSIYNDAVVKRKPFKFFNMWLKHEKYLEALQVSWEQDICGTAMYILCKKLKRLKKPLRDMNKLHFSHISARADAAAAVLNDLQMQFNSNPNDSLADDIRAQKLVCARLDAAEKSFISQKNKGLYLQLSDRGSKFFHSILKRNTAKKHISNVTLLDGTVSSSYDEMETEFVRFYTGLLGTHEDASPVSLDVINAGPILDPGFCEDLLAPVTALEIKKVLFSFSDGKAPGPDGYTAGFFKKSWDVVGKDFTNAVLEFFNQDVLLKQINHAAIALIPKNSHASSVSDYRPISCCNVTYKVISKILANRLVPCLPGLIDPAQTGFVDGRAMTDNIFLCQELIRKYGVKRKSPKCLIQVDIKKAFDSVHWSFLHSMLVGLGFPVKFVQWIMICISTASYSVAINGALAGFFNGKRGLRQGDPLSPFLFVLGMEYLSRKFRILACNSEFNFHWGCEQHKIIHLAFADDLMLFSRADPISLSLLMDCLIDFGDVSGLKTNLSKSKIFFAGVTAADKMEMLAIAGLEEGSFPIRYLGIPLAAVRLNVVHYEPLFDKLRSLFGNWKGNTLSYAGRLEVIRSVLQGVYCFWLGIFPIIGSVKSKMEQMCRRFLWSGDIEAKKRPPIAWHKVCRPKDEGGLGIFDLKARNLSLLCRVFWNFQAKKDSLFVKWIHQFYLAKTNTDVWTYTVKKDDSALIKTVFGIRDRFLMSFGNPDAAAAVLTSWEVGGKLSAKSAYDFFRRHGPRVWWSGFVWHHRTTPKHSFILWMAMGDNLSTTDRLDFVEDKMCSLCKQADESAAHLFFRCPLTAAVLKSIYSWLGVHRSFLSLHAAVRWLRRTSRGSKLINVSRKMALSATLYWIWHMRNKMRMDGVSMTHKEVVQKIKIHLCTILYSLYPSTI